MFMEADRIIDTFVGDTDQLTWEQVIAISQGVLLMRQEYETKQVWGIQDDDIDQISIEKQSRGSTIEYMNIMDRWNHDGKARARIRVKYEDSEEGVWMVVERSGFDKAVFVEYAF
jgi:hypothetical protein